MANSAPFILPSVFTAIDKFSGPMKIMGNAINGFVGRSERMLGRANAAFTKLLTPITNLNRMLMGLGFYVGLFTLIRIVKNAIDIFANFEQANVDLAVVMGTTVKENKVLAAEARRIGLAFGEGATGVVKMQHALATLGFERADILKMGRPLITGSAALEGADPERLAGTVGVLINAFDNLESKDTQHILDVMALSANRTALNFEKLATTLPIVSPAANAVNISFEETIALLGVLANAGVHVATSGTALKNIFIDSKKRGHDYAQVLENIAKHADKLTYANKQFGKKSVISALALTNHMHDAKNGVIALTDEFKKAKLGLTEAIAVQRLNTFRGAQKLFSSAYEEFILSIEDGNGSLAQSLTRILRVGSAMLLLSSDSDQAREAIAKMAPDILNTANKWLGWLKVIGWTTAALIAVRIALLVWRGLLIVTTALQGLWSIAMGVAAANGWLNVWALRGNIVALTTLRTVTWLAVAAQNAFNFALKVNPIYLIAIAILELVDAYAKLKQSTKESQEEELIRARHHGIKFEKTPKSAWNTIEDMFSGTTDLGIAKFSENRIPKSWSREESDSTRIANKNALDEAQVDSILNVLKGKVTVHFNDPDEKIKSAKSDSSNIMPVIDRTNGNW